MKQFNQAINGAFVLARRADHLAVDNNSLRYKVESMKKSLTLKSNLNLELDKKCKEFKVELKGKSQCVEELTTDLANEKGVAKACLVEKVGIEAETDSWQWEKEASLTEKAQLKVERDSSWGERAALQTRLDELE
ncbi:hypothetical protein LIER_40167 [Lithospermum erythrorhizon]|uniref:Uncharacterized protein n=1 Tax=Lithospermum erythrorhizon TaxID=34254 RepID=A0AAV3QRN0_LITER